MQASSLQYKNATISLLLLTPVLFLLISSISVLYGTKEDDQNAQEDDQPPIILLSEAAGFTFATGSAQLSTDLAAALKGVVAERIALLALKYRCDVVEVVGHTDGQRLSGVSTLDDDLLSYTSLGQQLPSAGSNADLGLLRAWAVIDVLRRDDRLRSLSFAGYSAGQALETDGTLANPSDRIDRPERRRIEVRLRRSVSIESARTPRSTVEKSGATTS